MFLTSHSVGDLIFSIFLHHLLAQCDPFPDRKNVKRFIGKIKLHKMKLTFTLMWFVFSAVWTFEESWQRRILWCSICWSGVWSEGNRCMWRKTTSLKNDYHKANASLNTIFTYLGHKAHPCVQQREQNKPFQITEWKWVNINKTMPLLSFYIQK